MTTNVLPFNRLLAYQPVEKQDTRCKWFFGVMAALRNPQQKLQLCLRFRALP
jgi:hypothetical protein